MALTKGFTCKTCMKRHEFGLYVVAHWDIRLTHTCDCGAKHTILRGRTRQIEEGKKPDINLLHKSETG